jgi:hypothetical protein
LRGGSRGDQILEWAGNLNDAFQSRKILPLKMKSLQSKAVAEQVPVCVFCIDFTEPKDGAQKLIYDGRSLYEACKELLRNARFVGIQYVLADVVYDGLGRRNLAHSIRDRCKRGAKDCRATSFASPDIPYCDTTMLCKKMGGHPISGVLRMTEESFPSYYA